MMMGVPRDETLLLGRSLELLLLFWLVLLERLPV